MYVEDDADAVETAVGRFTRGADTADLVLTAGSASTDPEDAFFVAIAALGGRVVRRGVPSHPGSMLWLARVGGTSILGLPTCGAYSKATAADLLLPRLLAGEPRVRGDRREARPRRHPHARPAVPLPALRPGAGRTGRVGRTPMGEADIAAAISRARAHLRRTRPKRGTATARRPLDRGWAACGSPALTRVDRDRHGHGIGGGGSAPSPGWMRAAYASCVATLIAMRAAEEGGRWALEVWSTRADDRGILAMTPGSRVR